MAVGVSEHVKFLIWRMMSSGCSQAKWNDDGPNDDFPNMRHGEAWNTMQSSRCSVCYAGGDTENWKRIFDALSVVRVVQNAEPNHSDGVGFPEIHNGDARTVHFDSV